MALLTLKDIGKIYVSDENVSVGIRGVNLSFDLGEFVAVTGKSGSGKSTLLNVISGVDSYEEGELYIEGGQTSHYMQPDWEEYREKYISFIFQDYNIIESFTVLENVELALMHIEDRAERRARALSLIERVGLSSHIRHKGSRLSGGQKQRTVIARALAKNSPIILADEPTGNLDSATSREIIDLLREVSKDKLLIVVTHNFEEVADKATRHIRIFDGAIEFDHEIREPEKFEPQEKIEQPRDKKDVLRRNVKNGFVLGRSIFFAKPRLSLFLSLLLILGTLGMFIVTSFCGDISAIFEPHYMFRHIDGRVIVSTVDGRALSEDEIAKLADELGAESYLRFDALIDRGAYTYATLPIKTDYANETYVNMEYTFSEDFGEPDIGRYPESAGEAFLYLPIYYSTELGRDALKAEDVFFDGIDLKIVGVKYFYDNNLPTKCLLTEEGFRTVTAMHYLFEESLLSVGVSLSSSDEGEIFETTVYSLFVSFDMPSDKVYIDSKGYGNAVSELTPGSYSAKVNFSATYYGNGKNDGYYGDYYGNIGSTIAPDSSINFGSSSFERIFTEADLASEKPSINKGAPYYNEDALILSDELLREIAESSLNATYRQASIFFSGDAEAGAAAEIMRDKGYVAVASYTTFEPDPLSTIGDTLYTLMLAFVWGISIVFLAFFVNLCSSGVISAFKGDMSIMRSMGIPVTVIRIGMYVRMMISLIPALVLLPISAAIIFLTPDLNEIFVYLYGWQYALIVIGVIILAVRVTYKQIAMLFGESVKKSLRRGGADK